MGSDPPVPISFFMGKTGLRYVSKHVAIVLLHEFIAVATCTWYDK